jgi:hypothetical protein
MDPVHFINADLEIVAREPLDAVAADLGDDVFVMYCGPTERGYLASFEIPGNSADAGPTVRALCLLIESLGAEARALWDRALGRSFDLGKIAVERRGRGSRLWTIISAPPFDRIYRTPIYRLEQHLQNDNPEALDFRLINLDELSDHDAAVLPSDAIILFDRR